MCGNLPCAAGVACVGDEIAPDYRVRPDGHADSRTDCCRSWQTYTNQQLGYSVMFPGKPVEATGTYRTDLVPEATTHYAKLVDGSTTFVVLGVATGQPDEGTTFLGEFEYWLTQIGQIALDNISGLNVGMQLERQHKAIVAASSMLLRILRSDASPWASVLRVEGVRSEVLTMHITLTWRDYCEAERMRNAFAVSWTI
jgi:hypothetical protein